MNPEDKRRTPRFPVQETLPVNDAITESNLGHIGNLSSHGMMLIMRREPGDEAIYQLQTYLPGAGGTGRRIQIGVQEQWHEPAGVPGQYWAGFRIIAIDPADARALDAWLSASLPAVPG